jgi:hypothetical protein
LIAYAKIIVKFDMLHRSILMSLPPWNFFLGSGGGFGGFSASKIEILRGFYIRLCKHWFNVVLQLD